MDTPTDDPGPPVDHLQTSSRDEGELRGRLEAWMARRPEVGLDLRIDRCERPDANGMSSDTLLVDASWEGDGDRVRRRYVARVAPEPAACPIFPAYDLERQARVMRLVGTRTAAPVPDVPWYEPDGTHLGGTFFIMDRVDGAVPPDVMPYPFDGSWVRTATPAQRARLQDGTIDVLVAVHGLEATAGETAFLRAGDPGSAATPLRQHFEAEHAFYQWAREGLRFPVLERAFEWLDARWPRAADDAPAVVCWGDARIGNIVYRDFEPRAVLDWEMATLAPRELDLGWSIFLHRFFDDITTELGMAGLPDLFRRDDVVACYAARSGHEPRDLDWFLVYAALRHGIVMSRAMRRRVLFGEMQMPEDPQDLVLHRRTLERMLDQT